MYQKTCWCVFQFLFSPVHYIVYSPVCSPVHNLVYSPMYSVVYSPVWSIQLSALLDTSGHSWTQLEHSQIHLEHSCSTFGVWPRSTSGAQLEHVWCAVQVHSWSTARTSGTQLAYSPSAHLDTFGANLCTAGHIWCADQGYSAVYSPGYHPVYILCTAHVQSRILSSVYPVYSSVFIPCIVQGTVQCTFYVQSHLQFNVWSSIHSSIYPVYSSVCTSLHLVYKVYIPVISSIGPVFLCLSSPHQ